MTLQAFSPSLFASARESRERSFWRRLLGAIMEGRQRRPTSTSGTICAANRASILTSSAASSSGGFWVSR